jgi:dipeptidyl-peptidase-4
MIRTENYAIKWLKGSGSNFLLWFWRKTNTVFYQSTERINQRAIYRIALNGKSKLALSDEIGTNDATFSPNYQYYINTFSSSAQATTYTLNEAKTGTQIKVIENNAALVAKLKL